MPLNSDGFVDCSHDPTITIRALPGDSRAHVCLAGEIDVDASVVLSRAVDWLAMSAPVHVLVDLADLTFAGATLPNFLAHVRQVLPGEAGLTLWRPRPPAEWVLRITGMATIAHIRNGAAVVEDHLSS